jgi:hypothetical protein
MAIAQAIVKAVVGFITGGALGAIADKLAEAYKAKQDAATEQDRIAADERIATLQAQRDVMIAEAGSPINGLIRLAFALPVAIYLGKLILWDKVLGLGATDNLSPQLWTHADIIVGFYFLHWTAKAVTARRK